MKEKRSGLNVCCILAADWPMERRLLLGTQYLCVQNAQSALSPALRAAHCVRMPPGWKDTRDDTDAHIWTHGWCLTRLCLGLVCQGWDAYEYSCYWREETARSWSDAKDFCKGQDSVLVHVGDL